MNSLSLLDRYSDTLNLTLFIFIDNYRLILLILHHQILQDDFHFSRHKKKLEIFVWRNSRKYRTTWMGSQRVASSSMLLRNTKQQFYTWLYDNEWVRTHTNLVKRCFRSLSNLKKIDEVVARRSSCNFRIFLLTFPCDWLTRNEMKINFKLKSKSSLILFEQAIWGVC